MLTKLSDTEIYLIPIPLPRNLIVQSNNAVTAVGRTLQMGSKSNYLVEHAEAITWRYITLSKLVQEAHMKEETFNEYIQL